MNIERIYGKVLEMPREYAGHRGAQLAYRRGFYRGADRRQLTPPINPYAKTNLQAAFERGVVDGRRP